MKEKLRSWRHRWGNFNCSSVGEYVDNDSGPISHEETVAGVQLSSLPMNRQSAGFVATFKTVLYSNYTNYVAWHYSTSRDLAYWMRATGCMSRGQPEAVWCHAHVRRTSFAAGVQS
jgi:hypothetical protein